MAQTADRNVAEIVVPIEEETEVVTAVVAPAAEVVVGDVDAAAQAAAAVAVLAAAGTAEAVTKSNQKHGVRASRPSRIKAAKISRPLFLLCPRRGRCPTCPAEQGSATLRRETPK